MGSIVKWMSLGLCMAGVLTLTACAGSDEKIKQGMQQIGGLEYREALASFDEAEELGEDDRLIARGRGIASMGLTEYDNAVEYFRESLSLSSGIVGNIDFDLNYYLAAAYMKEGSFESAKSTYDAILALRPQDKEAYFLRGNAFLALGAFEEGRQDFDHVIEMEPGNFDRLISIYEILAHYGYVEAGQEYLQAALDRYGEKMNTYDSGRIYYYLGEYQKAYIALEKAKDRGGADSYLYLGKAYEATGDYNYASSVYNSCLSKGEGNAEIYNQLGLCEMSRRDYRKALEAFQAGKELQDIDMMQTLSFNEIAAYEHLGNFQRALELVDEYLANYPDDAEAARERRFLSTR